MSGLKTTKALDLKAPYGAQRVVSQALEHHIDTGRKHAVVACFKLRDLRA